MWSVTASNPPCASICIISEVPERGRPETMMISGSMGPCFLEEAGRRLRAMKRDGLAERHLGLAGSNADYGLSSRVRLAHLAVSIHHRGIMGSGLLGGSPRPLPHRVFGNLSSLARV